MVCRGDYSNSGALGSRRSAGPICFEVFPLFGWKFNIEPQWRLTAAGRHGWNSHIRNIGYSRYALCATCRLQVYAESSQETTLTRLAILLRI